MYKFSIKTDRIEFEVELKDKYILIDGHSGQGKSLFVSEVERILDVNSNEIKSDLPVHVIESRDALLSIDIICSRELAVFISDEERAPKVIEKIQGKRAYCIVVTRKIYSNYNMQHVDNAHSMKYYSVVYNFSFF